MPSLSIPAANQRLGSILQNCSGLTCHFSCSRRSTHRRPQLRLLHWAWDVGPCLSACCCHCHHQRLGSTGGSYPLIYLSAAKFNKSSWSLTAKLILLFLVARFNCFSRAFLLLLIMLLNCFILLHLFAAAFTCNKASICCQTILINIPDQTHSYWCVISHLLK